MIVWVTAQHLALQLIASEMRSIRSWIILILVTGILAW